MREWNGTPSLGVTHPLFRSRQSQDDLRVEFSNCIENMLKHLLGAHPIRVGDTLSNSLEDGHVRLIQADRLNRLDQMLDILRDELAGYGHELAHVVPGPVHLTVKADHIS